METSVRRILALGGHGFSARPPDRAVCELLLRLAGERGSKWPRICILPEAGGNASEQVAGFYAVFGERACQPSDVSLFRLGRRPTELRDHLLGQDLIYASGSSMPNLLAGWEAHDVDSILGLACSRGTVLAGQGAGAMCWFEAGIAGASGKPRPIAGLSLLPGSLCVRYNNEPERRAVYLAAVSDGMAGGYGLDDYAGLLWEGQGPPAAVTARRGARAYRVKSRAGEVSESPLPARFLPAPAPATLREDIAEFRRIKTMRKRAGWLS